MVTGIMEKMVRDYYAEKDEKEEQLEKFLDKLEDEIEQNLPLFFEYFNDDQREYLLSHFKYELS